MFSPAHLREDPVGHKPPALPGGSSCLGRQSPAQAQGRPDWGASERHSAWTFCWAKPCLMGLKNKDVQIYSRCRYVCLCALAISRWDPVRKPGRSEDVDAQDQGFTRPNFFFSSATGSCCQSRGLQFCVTFST